MSRLIIKNLPPHLTIEGLRDHFLQPKAPVATLTDVKVALKKDGTSRRFGFVGFKTSEEAERAQKWFNKTFIGSSRIAVEVIDVSLRPLYPNPGYTFDVGCERRACSPT